MTGVKCAKFLLIFFPDSTSPFLLVLLSSITLSNVGGGGGFTHSHFTLAVEGYGVW